MAIALPLVLLGCFALAQKFPLHAPRVLLVSGFASLLVPTAHLSYTKLDSINPLPLELLRLLRWI